MKKIVLLLLLGIFSYNLIAENFTEDSFSVKDSIQGSGEIFKLSGLKEGILLSSILTLNCVDIGLSLNKSQKNTTWDGKILDSTEVNSFDRFFMQPYSKKIDVVGDVFQLVSLLTPAVLFSVSSQEWITIGTMYLESVFLAYGLKELGKAIVNRPRPYMYFTGYPEKDVKEGDWNCSFPSGHTTLAFTGATFASYVFTNYYPQSKFKLPVILGSYALAASTGICRIASGNHFVTDVLAGAVLGSFSGFIVPFLHKVNNTLQDEQNRGLAFMLSSQQFSVVYSF